MISEKEVRSLISTLKEASDRVNLKPDIIDRHVKNSGIFEEVTCTACSGYGTYRDGKCGACKGTGVGQ